METTESKVILEFPDVNTNLNIKARVWGISGNHEMTTISDVDDSSSDSSQTQIFHTSEIYYRRNGTNTLVVYAPESSFNTLSDSIGRVKLVVVLTDSGDMLNDLAITYKARGLSKLSAYDNNKE